MLHRSLKVHRAITYLNNSILSPNNPNIGLIDEREWRTTKAMRNILNAFLKPTQHLSGSYYPTSHCVLPHLVEISYVLKSHIEYPCLQHTIHAMLTKLRDYFVPFPPLFHVATMLDPQYKYDGTRQLLLEFYNNSNVPEAEMQAEKLHEEARELLKGLYRHHRDAASTREQAPTLRPSTSSHSFGVGLFKRSKQIIHGLGSSSRASDDNFSDLLVYQGQRCDVGDVDGFDILKWWREKSNSMSVLSLVARDVLAPPASTVSSESAFSSGGRVLNPHRHSLNPETVEACVCLKDWNDAEERRQTDPHFWWPEDSTSTEGSHDSISPPDIHGMNYEDEDDYGTGGMETYGD